MSANQSEKIALDQVLEALIEQKHAPSAEELRRWLDRYPQFNSEIIAFATAWVEMDAMPAASEPTEDEVNLVVNRTMSRVQELLDASQRQSPIVNLVAEIGSAGHDMVSFQRMLGIDASILTCLAERMIKPATIPFKLIKALAEALARGIDEIRSYLLLPPKAQAAYKSKKKPAPSQTDFATLITHSSLSETEKTAWLAEPIDQELRG